MKIDVYCEICEEDIIETDKVHKSSMQHISYN